MNRRWICNDVWMDIFPSFDHAQLGLKMALLSPRFNALVDKHFDGKSELTIWRTIKIRGKDSVTTEAAASEFILFMDDDNTVPFPLPSKIRFKHLQIEYIDHFITTFLRSNHQIFDKRGTDLQLLIPSSHTTDGQPIWDVFVREIWPIFSTNIRHLGFYHGDHLDHLLRRTSPTVLTDLVNLNSIDLHWLLPESFGDDFDGPNATISAGKALSKWLHIPRKDGQPKRLRCKDYNGQIDFNWVNNFKEAFLRATISSVNYEIHFTVYASSMVPFELENEWTKEKLTLAKAKKLDNNWIMKRCKIIGETEEIQQKKKDANWDNNCNNVSIWLYSDTHCIGPLSPPPEEAGQSITKGPSSVDK